MRAHSMSRRGRRPLAVRLVAAALLGPLFPVPVSASVAPAGPEVNDATAPRLLDEVVDFSFGGGGDEDLWTVAPGFPVWQTGRMGYVAAAGPYRTTSVGVRPDMFPSVSTDPTPSVDPGSPPYVEERPSAVASPGSVTRGYEHLIAIDLTTNTVAARTVLEPPITPSADGDPSRSVVLDERAGVLVAAYSHRSLAPAAFVPLPPVTHGGPSHDICTNAQTGDSRTYCVAGFHLLDAGTLASRGRIDMDTLLLDGVMSAPQLLAMRVQDGKLLTLFTDATKWQYAYTDQSPHHTAQANIHYAMQFDLASGRQDWIVRVDACRGAREGGAGWNADGGKHVRQPYRASIFRSVQADAVWVACHNSSAQTGTLVGIPLDASGTASSTAAPNEPDPERPATDTLSQPPPQAAHFGPDKVQMVLADPASGRFLLRTVDPRSNQEVWWVFDTTTEKFVGTVGIGYLESIPTVQVAFDERRGRLYELRSQEQNGSNVTPGGLFTVDVRRSPLPQALHYAHIEEAVPELAAGTSFAAGILATESSTRLYFTTSPDPFATRRLGVIEDQRPEAIDVPLTGHEGRTTDLDEVEGVTQATFDGATRGYGARVLLVGGVEAATRVGPLDPLGEVAGTQYALWEKPTGGNTGADLGLPPPYAPCYSTNRELVLGFIGPEAPAVLDASGSRAAALPVVADSSMRADAHSPVSRCVNLANWNDVWQTALFGAPPVDEPHPEWPFPDQPVSCVSGSQQEQESYGEPVTGGFSAKVDCGETDAGGWSQARGFGLDGVAVGQAMSSFRVYRDPARGIVSRIESVAGGIAVENHIRIDSVRTVAESWANGRRQPVPDTERPDDYEPNCDFDRTAGTCLQRHIFGVSTPGYRCGPCADEQRLLDGLNRAVGANGVFAFREPEPELAEGAENGYIAGIAKPDEERFSDLVLNNDLLQTVLPGLEFVRYAPAGRRLSGQPPRGRQVFQFAGVEATTSYGIQCLLVYDAEANTCAPAAEELGSLTIQLTDTGGAPLSGGAFEVRRDVDTDGVVGLVDELLPDGACVTGEDGIGGCAFDGLEAGPYLVSQTAAPAGYSAVTEPWVSELAPGEARTVTFTNTSNLSTIEMTATDADGNPVEGATFAVLPDPDADGKVAPDAAPVATCTTDATGVCTMTVPAGSYVLVQTVAPAGMEPIEPVAFAFASGGQTAAVGVVNQPTSGDATTTPAPAAGRTLVNYAPPIDTAPREAVTGTAPSDSVAEPKASLPDQVGGTVVRVIRAPGDALRLLARDPMQAAAWTAAILLFTLAVLAVRRRQLLGTLTAAPVLAFTGSAPTATPPPAVPTSGTATAVRDRPTVAGAAPEAHDPHAVRIVVATAFSALASVVDQRLGADGRCRVAVTVDSLEDLRAALTACRPDVLVVDLALRTDDDRQLVEVLDELHSPARTVGLVRPHHSSHSLIGRAHRAGIAALLGTDEDLTNGQLAYAVRAVASGKLFYGPSVQTVLSKYWTDAARRPGRKAEQGLTGRELEIAVLAARGLGRTEIARRLFLSAGTVKRHLRTIRAKLGVTDPWDPQQIRRRLEDAGAIDEWDEPPGGPDPGP